MREILSCDLTLVKPAQMPKDGAFDFTICVRGIATYVSLDDQHRAFAWIDEQGFAHSSPSGGLFDMTWFRCAGSGSVIEGTRSISDHCEVTDQDGDTMFVVHRYTIDLASGSRESEVVIVAGTGKYDGIRGMGESQPLARIPADNAGQPGVYVVCVRTNGDYEIP